MSTDPFQLPPYDVDSALEDKKETCFQCMETTWYGLQGYYYEEQTLKCLQNLNIHPDFYGNT